MSHHLKSWVDHCKQYAKDNGIKYSECLKNNHCRGMYHSQKGSAKVPQPEVEVDLELVKVKSSGKGRRKPSH